jgi:hypothetical protein
MMPRVTFARLQALADVARRWGAAERARRTAAELRLENTDGTRRADLAAVEAAADERAEAAATALLEALSALWPGDG